MTGEALAGVKLLHSGNIQIFDLSKAKNTSYAINTLKSIGAKCFKENDKFIWYLDHPFSYDKLVFDSSCFNGRLFQYQTEDVNKIINMHRCLNATATGLGKTIESIAAISFLQRFNNENKKILIVAPRSLQQQWKGEILAHSNLSVSIYGEENFKDSLVQIITYERMRIGDF